MHQINNNIKRLIQRMAQVAQTAGRNADHITLLAVSKTQTASAIRQAHAAGLHHFGENYLQEALEKHNQLSDLDICWHFIGPIQSNKTRQIAANFSWVHSVDRLKIAQRLSAQRPACLPPLNLCLQVNIDGEATKSGIYPKDAASLAIAIAPLPNIHLRGLMAIPTVSPHKDKQRNAFFRLRQLLDTLSALSPELAKMDTLSMGMSADMDAAIMEGSSLIRVGTALFGSRKPQPQPIEDSP